MDIGKYRTIFLNESRENVQRMTERILQLSQTPTQEGFDWLFRTAHSIKGMSASMGYQQLAGLTHKMENLIDKLKKGQLTLDQETQSVLFHGIDLIEVMLNEIERSGNTETPTNTFEMLLQNLRTSSPKLPAENKFLYKLELKISPDCPLPAARAIVILKRIEELGRMSKVTPSANEIVEGRFHGTLLCYIVTPHAASHLEEALSRFTEIDSISLTAVDPFTRYSPEADAPPMVEQAEESFRMNSIRVEAERVDRLIEGLGELLIHHGQLQERHPDNHEISRLYSQARQLYYDSRDLRMLPFETVCGRMPRIVHDLCKKLEKKIRLKIQGAEIEMDRTILAELADPMIHLIRNAVDHGIETPAERRSAGKNETGTIAISVAKKGERLLISIEDDGRGLDPEVIKRIAIEKHLIQQQDAGLFNQQEILMLIMRPGFSTAAVVSEISGRGVGLDAVRAKIDSLGGELKIYSTQGRFARFEINVPFTIAVIPVLLVRVRRLICAVPLSRIERVVLINKKDLHTTEGRPVVFQENLALYLENLGHLLYGEPGEYEQTFPAFVCEHQNRSIAWVVEELIAEKEILLKSLGEPLNQISWYAGATVLSRGEVVPVLDMEQLYREKYE